MGALVSFDVNTAHGCGRGTSRPVLSELARTATSSLPPKTNWACRAGRTQDETSAAARLHASGVNQLVIKRGSRGASVSTVAPGSHADALAVDVRDTIGAGGRLHRRLPLGVLDGMDSSGTPPRGTVAAHSQWRPSATGRPAHPRELELLDSEAGERSADQHSEFVRGHRRVSLTTGCHISGGHHD
jgi:hypothetical protein